MIVRQCTECNNPFFIEFETDALCDECAGVTIRPHHLTNFELNGRDWENKEIKKQWQKTYKKSQDKIMSNVKGCHYINKVLK